MRILAIDPGSARSAWLFLDTDVGQPREFDLEPNDDVVRHVGDWRPYIDVVAIEWMSPRGLPTSAQEFETMFWAGRFAQAAQPVRFARVKRDDVKYHLCGRRAKVGDVNVRAALIDRFGGIGGKAAAVGTKKAPGPLYGISNDIWAALGVAVTYADKEEAV